MREVELKVVAPLKEVIIGLSAPEGGCIWPGSLLNWSACKPTSRSAMKVVNK